MTKFYVSKYKIKLWTRNDEEYIPIGTIFTIDCLNGNCFDLKPIKPFDDEAIKVINVEPNMLKIAFTEQDFINETNQNNNVS